MNIIFHTAAACCEPDLQPIFSNSRLEVVLHPFLAQAMLRLAAVYIYFLKQIFALGVVTVQMQTSHLLWVNDHYPVVVQSLLPHGFNTITTLA